MNAPSYSNERRPDHAGECLALVVAWIVMAIVSAVTWRTLQEPELLTTDIVHRYSYGISTWIYSASFLTSVILFAPMIYCFNTVIKAGAIASLNDFLEWVRTWVGNVDLRREQSPMWQITAFVIPGILILSVTILACVLLWPIFALIPTDCGDVWDVN